MKTIFFSLLAFILILSSCQPGVDDTSPPAPPENDSIYISRVVELDTTFPTGTDTARYTMFDYDASKRISHIWDGEYFPGEQGADLTDEYFFFYTGSDTLPSKMIHLAGSAGYSSGFEIYSYDTSYLYYNSAGFIIRDSTVTADESQVYKKTTVTLFTRIEDGHYRIDKKEITANGTVEGYSKNHFVIANGNMISSIDTTFNADGSIGQVNIETSSYDQHPNPLLRASLRYPGSTGYYGIPGQPSFNNPTRWERFMPVGGGGINDHSREIYEYKYRADGYPIRSVCDLEPAALTHYIYTKR